MLGGGSVAKRAGLARVQLNAYLVGVAYNAFRISRVQPATG